MIFTALSVTVEQKKSKDVDNEPGNTDEYHTVHFFDLVRVRQSLDRLDEDGEAESDEEDGVDQSTQYFSTCPAVRVLSRVLLRHLTTDQQYRATVENLSNQLKERTMLVCCWSKKRR